jgi:hypothetical protein
LLQAAIIHFAFQVSRTGYDQLWNFLTKTFPLMGEVPRDLLESLTLTQFPASFMKYIFLNTDFETQQELPGKSLARVYIVRPKRGEPLIFKTNPRVTALTPRHVAHILSLFSVRFYFLAPIQGFTLTSPFGFLYTHYGELQTLSQFIRSTAAKPGTAMTLIAAFISYGMARLEATQTLHGSLHSGNIFLTTDLLPVITDWGLGRDYRLFDEDGRNDELGWVPPELVLTGHANYNADTYAYGALLYEMFEGRRLFSQLTNRELLIGLRRGGLLLTFEKTPGAWQPVIAKCCDSDPDLRPSFCEIFSAFQTGKLAFPDTNAADVATVLAQYTIARIFDGLGIPAEKPAPTPAPEPVPAPRPRPAFPPTPAQAGPPQHVPTSPSAASPAVPPKQVPPVPPRPGAPVAPASPFRPSFPPAAAGGAAPPSPVDPLAILASPGNANFRDSAQSLAKSIAIDKTSAFVTGITQHVTATADASLVTFILSTIKLLCDRGPDFLSAVIGTDIFGALPLSAAGHHSIILSILDPLFGAQRKLLTGRLYRCVGRLFVALPAQMLNVMARFVTTCDARDLSFWNIVHLFLGLWSLFHNSSLSSQYVELVGYLVSVSGDFWEQNRRVILGIMTWFSTGEAMPGLVSSLLFIAKFAPDELRIQPPIAHRLIGDDHYRSASEAILLRAPSLPADVDFVRGAVARAKSSSDGRGWALLLKFAGQSEAHAQALLAVPGWADPASESIEAEFRLVLAVFVNQGLRGLVLRLPDFPALLVKFVRPALLADISHMLARSPLDRAFIQAVSQSGFLRSYLGTCLSSQDIPAIKAGIVTVDVMGRVGFAEEWLMALQEFLNLFRTKFEAVGDDLISVLATLSGYQQMAAAMKSAGLVPYYQNLFRYDKYKGFATYFITNMARF